MCIYIYETIFKTYTDHLEVEVVCLGVITQKCSGRKKPSKEIVTTWMSFADRMPLWGAKVSTALYNPL